MLAGVTMYLIAETCATAPSRELKRGNYMNQKIQNEWVFGLWAECPKHAPVAWGARAIAEDRTFGILPDRQTWEGPGGLRKAFSRLINDGPIQRAAVEYKRLRYGWSPLHDLEQRQFVDWWNLRRRDEPDLFSSWRKAGTLREPPANPQTWGYDYDPSEPDSPDRADPAKIHRCLSEKSRYVRRGHREEIYDGFCNIISTQRAKVFLDKSKVCTLFDDGDIVIKGDTRSSYGYIYMIAYPKHDVSAVEKKWSGDGDIPKIGADVTVRNLGKAKVIAHRAMPGGWAHLTVIPERLPEFWHNQRDDFYFQPAKTWNVAGCELEEDG